MTKLQEAQKKLAELAVLALNLCNYLDCDSEEQLCNDDTDPVKQCPVLQMQILLGLKKLEKQEREDSQR